MGMTEFFAKATGQITGPIIISAFFPVLMFLAAFTLVVLPLTPYGHDFTAAIQNPAMWQKYPVVALVLTLGALALSVLLYNLNTPIVRLFEGYPWQHAWIAWPFVRMRKRHLIRVRTVRTRIRTLRRILKLSGLSVDLSGAASEQGKLAHIMNDRYPDRNDLVLPTRLGNVIRSFETYTSRQYGMPAIALWPRLLAVVDGNFASSLDAVKTSFDFMIHCAFLSAALAIITAASGLFWKTRTLESLWGPWLAWAIGFGLISHLFYLVSITRAIEWGTQVKSAFDLYRLPLLAKLGYELKPADLADERRIWDNLNYKFAFPDERSYPDLPYRLPSTYLIVEPASTVIKWTRSVMPLEDGSLQISLVISNLDPTAWDADRVIAREEVPPGKVYVRDSALVNGAPAILLSVDPLQIDIGQCLTMTRVRSCTESQGMLDETLALVHNRLAGHRKCPQLDRKLFRSPELGTWRLETRDRRAERHVP